LGLLAALVRRERIDAVQRLDGHIASTLRGHSQVHQREQALDLLQQQASAMPALVARLESMMAALEQQSQAAHERQVAQQEAFHASTGAAYRELAQSVGQSLQASAAEGARIAGEALAPVVESTMAGLSRQAESTHATLAQVSEQHLQAATERMSSAMQALDDGFKQRSQDLMERLDARAQASGDAMAAAWNKGLA